jgi:hypothetical protein
MLHKKAMDIKVAQLQKNPLCVRYIYNYLEIQAWQNVIYCSSSMEHMVLRNKPAGATEILSVTLTTAPQPFVLFSQLQELTAIKRKKVQKTIK